jgi:large subunit ribosomal protein L21
VLRTSVFAIFELGSKQYKVSPGDYIYAERLKGVDVGAQLALGKIQAAGSATETLVGRPYIAGASVTAVVEVKICHLFKKAQVHTSG